MNLQLASINPVNGIAVVAVVSDVPSTYYDKERQTKKIKKEIPCTLPKRLLGRAPKKNKMTLRDCECAVNVCEYSKYLNHKYREK